MVRLAVNVSYLYASLSPRQFESDLGRRRRRRKVTTITHKEWVAVGWGC